MDEIVTDPADTKSLPLPYSDRLQGLQSLVASDPFKHAEQSMQHPDQFVARVSAVVALLREINRSPFQTPPAGPMNATTVRSPPGALQAIAGKGAIASPPAHSLQVTAEKQIQEIIQVTTCTETITNPLPQSLRVTADTQIQHIAQVTAVAEAATSPVRPIDHLWLAKADDPWFVRIQKRHIAAMPKEQQEETCKAIMQGYEHLWREHVDDPWFVRIQKRHIAAMPKEQQEETHIALVQADIKRQAAQLELEKAAAPLERNQDAQVSHSGTISHPSGTGGTSYICIDCGTDFKVNGFIQRRIDDGSYQQPKRDAECRDLRRRLFAGAFQDRLTPNSSGGVGSDRGGPSPKSPAADRGWITPNLASTRAAQVRASHEADVRARQAATATAGARARLARIEEENRSAELDLSGMMT